MRRPRQLTFLKNPDFQHLARLEHGGVLRQGRRKLMRPLDPKRPLHLVLRSSRARGEWSLLRSRYFKRVRQIVESQARRHGVRIYQYANSGNHLHLLVKPDTREGFQAFLRGVSGTIARLITGARKGHPVGRFWDALAYSRVVEWGRAFAAAKFYVIQNELEGLGIWKRAWKNGPVPKSRL